MLLSITLPPLFLSISHTHTICLSPSSPTGSLSPCCAPFRHPPSLFLAGLGVRCKRWRYALAKIKKEPLQILTIPISAACVGWITNKVKRRNIETTVPHEWCSSFHLRRTGMLGVVVGDRSVERDYALCLGDESMTRAPLMARRRRILNSWLLVKCKCKLLLPQ